MMDAGPMVLEACQAAQVPCWRGGWQGGEGEHPPPIYAVFTMVDAPGRAADDRVRSWKYWAYLNVYGTGDVRAAGDRIAQEMQAQGWMLIDRRDEYDRGTGSYMDVMSWHREDWNAS